MFPPTSRDKQYAARPFHVLVKPVGPLCNLDCEYCFYLKKGDLYPQSKRFEMNSSMLAVHIKQYIDSQPIGTPEVTFGWQGGEPTMRGLPFFRQVVELQQRYARPGMRINNTLQTNGVLLNDEWGQFLHQAQFLVGISIDGDQALHDKYRKTCSGRGSYLPVLKGLRMLQKHQVEFNILTAVQSDNAQHGVRVYQHLKQLGAHFIQFIPIVEPVKGQRVSHRSVTGKQFGQFMIDVFELWRSNDIGKVFVGHFDNALAMHIGIPSSSCVHATQCGDNIVLEHNGDVYSCDHFVYPDFQLGNIHNTVYSDLIATARQKAFAQRKVVGIEQHCVGCSQRALCNGACPAQRIDSNGELSARAKHYLCDGYFAFFSHIRPYLEAMSECLRRQQPVNEYTQFLGQESTIHGKVNHGEVNKTLS
ncbi:anaerobic sulfatase maturase [Vibrio parahaemolyticus]|nr:anaerobic sulfatase maturase [Vibrio parahaemolyticus]